MTAPLTTDELERIERDVRAGFDIEESEAKSLLTEVKRLRAMVSPKLDGLTDHELGYASATADCAQWIRDTAAARLLAGDCVEDLANDIDSGEAIGSAGRVPMERSERDGGEDGNG